MADSRKKNTFRLFNKIWKRYELVNKVISFNRVKTIRKEIKNILENSMTGRQKYLLDVGGGTGIMSDMLNNRFDIKLVCDLSLKMMNTGSVRYDSGSIVFIESDACNLPIKDRSIDAALSVFVARNVDLKSMVNELYRVLKSGGCFLLCDFVLPPKEKPFFRHVYLTYMLYIMPIIAFLVSFKYSEYRYLAKSIKNWMTIEELMKQILLYCPENRVKFTHVKSICSDTVAIYRLKKL